jgi:hypothetical protein
LLALLPCRTPNPRNKRQDCRWFERFENPRLLEAKTLATIEIAMAAER